MHREFKHTACRQTRPAKGTAGPDRNLAEISTVHTKQLKHIIYHKKANNIYVQPSPVVDQATIALV